MRAPDRGRYGVESPNERPFPDDRIVLERDISSGREEFILDPPISYRARIPGHDAFVKIIVPRPGARFRTDLTSVPALFTWLVPKSGRHLPAALIHDGLLPDRPDSEAGGSCCYATEPPGIEIDRIDADRVFREAMFDTGVGLIRAYLAWAAVSVASLWVGPRAIWSALQLWYFRALIVLTFGTIAVLGYAATVDVLDLALPAFHLPWIREGSLAVEVGTGLAGAIVIPLLLAIPWGRYFGIAAITGVAVAALYYVTIAVAVSALAYQVIERSLGWALRRWGRGASLVAWVSVLLVVTGCTVVLVRQIA